MTVNIFNEFLKLLTDQVRYIIKDKLRAASKFRKDLKQTFQFKKSIYFDDENIRDYAFKWYASVYEIDVLLNTVFVFGFIKYKDSL